MPDRDRLTWVFFRLTGRVDRSVFVLAFLFLVVVQSFFLYRFAVVTNQGAQGEVWAFAFWISVAASLWSTISLGVKRLHDLDKPGLYSLTLFLPVVSIVVFVALCVLPGTPGLNRFGRYPNAPDDPAR